MATKRLKIKLEKHELKIVRFGRSQKLFCQSCQMETRHLTVAQMAQVLKLSEREVFRMVENLHIHSTETADGKLLVCLNSAANFEK